MVPFNWLFTVQIKEAFCRVEESTFFFPPRIVIFIVDDSCLLTLSWTRKRYRNHSSASFSFLCHPTPSRPTGNVCYLPQIHHVDGAAKISMIL